MTKYRIYLEEWERNELCRMVTRGKGKARDIQKANVLLASDEHHGRQSESEISEQYHLSTRQVERIRKRFCHQGMAIFEPVPRKTRSDLKVTGAVEAHILAISCSEPPLGKSHWTLQMIAD